MNNIQIDILDSDIYWFSIRITFENNNVKCYIDEPRSGFGNKQLKLEKFIHIEKMSKYVTNEFKLKKISEEKIVNFIWKFQRDFPRDILRIKDTSSNNIFTSKLKIMSNIEGNMKKYKLLKDLMLLQFS